MSAQTANRRSWRDEEIGSGVRRCPLISELTVTEQLRAAEHQAYGTRRRPEPRQQTLPGAVASDLERQVAESDMRSGMASCQRYIGRALEQSADQLGRKARGNPRADVGAARMSAQPQVSALTLAEAARIMREAVKDKSYQLTPIGAEIAGYLRAKRKRLTPDSYRDYEGGLDKLARFFPDLALGDLEPPTGAERLEEFLDAQWGERAPRTYNKNLSIMGDFFEWCVRKEKLHGDPTLTIERARARGVYRTTFPADQRRAIIAEQESRRDRICLRLMLDYALRKGALRVIQFKHFDHQRRRLTIFTKGQRVREVPLPHAEFWLDLERHILDVGASPSDFLLCRHRTIPVGKPDASGRRQVELRYFPDKPMSPSGVHRWWYACLANAGIVPEGVEHGERMHKARHTAGQRVLDASGNLKAVQKLLGHTSIQTTGDIYADWDIDQLASTMADVLAEDEG